MPLDVRGLAPLLQVFDMPASLHFYRDVLAFELVSSNRPEPPFDWVLLRLAGIELMLNTAYEADRRPSAPDPARVAAHEDTCLYFGAPDVDAVYRELLAKGLEVKPPKVAPYGMKQLYLSDPDGYALCFQWRA
jgi:catechol 2,3-dioxygenase-like lactoylglutathione lyase family enzyme